MGSAATSTGAKRFYISSGINTQAKEVGIFVPTSFYMSILCICKVIFVL